MLKKGEGEQSSSFNPLFFAYRLAFQNEQPDFFKGSIYLPEIFHSKTFCMVAKEINLLPVAPYWQEF